MIYAVGECEFDTSLYALRRAGRLIRLRPKVFQVLLYLLTHRERVITKDDLREAIWPGQFISDETLESTVSAVRQALGDSGRAQRCIQTLPGHGYRLVAPVTEYSKAPAEPPEPPGGATAPIPVPAGLPGSLVNVPVSSSEALLLLPSPATMPPDLPFAASRLPVAEHRQLTVLCCRLLEAMPQYDLEALHGVIRPFQDLCAAVVQRFEGQVAHYREDGVLVYFGWPVAHEDDAQRAVHTGLDMSAALHTLQARLTADQAGRLAVRIAIHTGPTIVEALGSNGHYAPLALGATPHLATALTALALPQTVLISEATQRLVQRDFATQPLCPYDTGAARLTSQRPLLGPGRFPAWYDSEAASIQ